MEEAGDMAALAIPFAAGSAVGQFATRLSEPVSWAIPGIILGLITLFLPFLLSHHRARLRYGFLFFLLGLLSLHIHSLNRLSLCKTNHYYIDNLHYPNMLYYCYLKSLLLLYLYQFHLYLAYMIQFHLILNHILIVIL